MELEGVACVGVAAPQDRTLWMHAVVNMVRCNCVGRLRRRVLRSALSPPEYWTIRCSRMPREVATACSRVPPTKELMASLSSPGKSVCCLLYIFNVPKSATSAAAIRCSASAACSVAPLPTGDNGRLAKCKVTSLPFSCEMASRKCLRTASRSSSCVAIDLRDTVIPCAVYNFRIARLSKRLLHSKTCFKRLLHRGCASCARSHSSKA